MCEFLSLHSLSLDYFQYLFFLLVIPFLSYWCAFWLFYLHYFIPTPFLCCSSHFDFSQLLLFSSLPVCHCPAFSFLLARVFALQWNLLPAFLSFILASVGFILSCIASFHFHVISFNLHFTSFLFSWFVFNLWLSLPLLPCSFFTALRFFIFSILLFLTFLRFRSYVSSSIYFFHLFLSSLFHSSISHPLLMPFISSSLCLSFTFTRALHRAV